MSKIIFVYKADGMFGESVVLKLEKDGDVTVSVCGLPRVDQKYIEPGESASMRLPARQIDGLIDALCGVGPRDG